MVMCKVCNAYTVQGGNFTADQCTEAKMKRECCALEMHATYEADINQV